MWQGFREWEISEEDLRAADKLNIADLTSSDDGVFGVGSCSSLSKFNGVGDKEASFWNEGGSSHLCKGKCRSQSVCS